MRPNPVAPTCPQRITTQPMWISRRQLSHEVFVAWSNTRGSAMSLSLALNLVVNDQTTPTTPVSGRQQPSLTIVSGTRKDDTRMKSTVYTRTAITMAAVSIMAAGLAANAQQPGQTRASRIDEMVKKAGAISTHYHPDTMFIVHRHGPTYVTSSHLPNDYSTPRELGVTGGSALVRGFQTYANRDLQATRQMGRVINPPKR